VSRRRKGHLNQTIPTDLVFCFAREILVIIVGTADILLGNELGIEAAEEA
jgi:hypothetical protein